MSRIGQSKTFTTRTSVSGNQGRRWRQTAAACAIMAAIVGLDPARARAEDAPGPSPTTSFKQEYGETRKALSGLHGKIDESVRSMEKLTTADAAGEQLDAFMGEVAGALGLLADNGTLATSSEKALDFARQKLRQFETDTTFSASERSGLLDGWRQTAREMEGATGELTAARRELSQLLTVLQSKRNYLTELQQLANAQDIARAIRQLAAELRGTSNGIRGFLRGFGTPES